MTKFKKAITLKGLSNYMNVIEEIIHDLNLQEFSFDIKLILTESLTNAFKHGNNSDHSKPIYLQYFYDGHTIKFKIKDCGNGVDNYIIPKEPTEADILNTSGKGLFLINCYADKVNFEKNILTIEKKLY